jgi:hypothetical protein
MATKNKESTRYFSDAHEKSICKALGGRQNSNSGAGHFNKGDVIVQEASLLIEAKCCMLPKSSVSIKKEWVEKNKQESFMTRKDNHAVCINFEPDGTNYYLIDEKLMKFLVEHLIIENNS